MVLELYSGPIVGNDPPPHNTLEKPLDEKPPKGRQRHDMICHRGHRRGGRKSMTVGTLVPQAQSWCSGQLATVRWMWALASSEFDALAR